MVKRRTAISGSKDVITAAKERIAYLFDNYDNIQLSFSGGKDSTCLFHLLNAEAKKRNRKFYVYFQDQEAEYQGTIDMVKWAMSQPNVIPLWYQVPIFMTNACSQEQLFLWAWGENENWVREKDPLSIHHIDEKYPKRFYKFNDWVGRKLAKIPGKSVSVIGLRAEESPDRRMVMFGEDNTLFWMRRKRNPNRAYPIIDWSFTDVWKFLIDNKLKYNVVYDKMYMLGVPLRQMRVSNLIHEKAYRCLTELQELEPETYNKLELRLKGVHCASIYAKERLVYSIKKLPPQFKTWKEYKDFLLHNMHPDLAKIFRFKWTRFGDTDDVLACKYMVKRLLLCDWEGNVHEPNWNIKHPEWDYNHYNYTKEQLKEKRHAQKYDEDIRKWYDQF